MKIIKASDMAFIPASHEDHDNPGVVKKILFKRENIESGWVQMINWCKLFPKRSFEAHYHETMDEIFIVVNGQVTVCVQDETAMLNSGDAVYIPARSVHVMKNDLDIDTIYIAIGIARGEGGKSINVQ